MLTFGANPKRIRPDNSILLAGIGTLTLVVRVLVGTDSSG
jgi:hypothetical protein